MKGSEWNGYPVFPFDRVEQYIDMTDVEILLTMGYSRMNANRRDKYEECVRRGFRIGTFVAREAVVYGEVGEGSIVMPLAYVGIGTTIGRCSIVRSGCFLTHDDVIGDFCWLSPRVTMGGFVKIGHQSFVGLNATLRNGITLANRTFVAAASYVHHSTETNSAYMGVPARKIPDKTAMDIIQRV